ncbi:gastrula zinc finger protein XlCGF46.1 [Anabrus simplex]|uniref:gastrula zinc finger protein XlCGF46.1 n=1 Tax=Anabrus simplex TaxID=316456 RepID=UPI0035A3AEA0
MDQKVELKQEPVWTEGTASTSFLFADVKDEMFIEERIVSELVPCFKEEDTVGSIAVNRRTPLGSCVRCCKIVRTGHVQPTDNGEVLYHCSCSEDLFPHSAVAPMNNKECSSTFSPESNIEGQKIPPPMEPSYLKGDMILRYAEHGNHHMSKVREPVIVECGKQKYSCNDCGYQFVQKANLKKHFLRNSGERPHVCDQCGMRFSLKYRLQEHMRSHSGIGRYICKVCGMFVKSKIKRHMLTHTGERSFSCTDCGRVFSQKSSLKRHMRIHTGERPNACTYCGKTFALKEALDNHILTHTLDRPFICDDCGASFSAKTNLRQHMKVHLRNEGPLLCNECGRSFPSKYFLSRHRLIHSVDTLYVCNECDRCFSRKDHLEDHILTH